MNQGPVMRKRPSYLEGPQVRPRTVSPPPAPPLHRAHQYVTSDGSDVSDDDIVMKYSSPKPFIPDVKDDDKHVTKKRNVGHDAPKPLKIYTRLDDRESRLMDKYEEDYPEVGVVDDEQWIGKDWLYGDSGTVPDEASKVSMKVGQLGGRRKGRRTRRRKARDGTKKRVKSVKKGGRKMKSRHSKAKHTRRVKHSKKGRRKMKTRRSRK